MDVLLDARTIFISLGIGHLFTLILISAYWHDHSKDITVQAFFAAKCAQTITWFCQAFRGEISDFLSISVSNSILFIGAAFEVIALLSLQNELRPSVKKIYFFATLCSIIGFQLVILFYNKEHIRVAYASLVTTLMVIPVYRMVLGRAHTLLMRIMGCLYLFVIVTSVIRGTVALISPTSISLMVPGIYQSITFLALYLVMILGNTGFILLLKEKADYELIRMASYDDLTGTLNRRTFTVQANQCLTDCAKKGMPLSYLLFDIDWFKTINDTFGHQTGDQVLQDLSAQIKQSLAKDDLFVRYGGDEFGILLPGKDKLASNDIAARIREVLSGAESRGLPVAYTISMGMLTLVPDQHTQLETLYTSCDKALYAAKHKGRDSISRSKLNDT